MEIMVKRLLLIAALGASVWSKESFITSYEYGEKLYNQPRGIGCSKCHGKKGEGDQIVSYKDGEKTVTLIAPNIRFMPASKIKEGVEKNHPSFVPKYFLVDDEYKSLQTFLEKK